MQGTRARSRKLRGRHLVIVCDFGIGDEELERHFSRQDDSALVSDEELEGLYARQVRFFLLLRGGQRPAEVVHLALVLGAAGNLGLCAVAAVAGACLCPHSQERTDKGAERRNGGKTQKGVARKRQANGLELAQQSVFLRVAHRGLLVCDGLERHDGFCLCLKETCAVVVQRFAKRLARHSILELDVGDHPLDDALKLLLVPVAVNFEKLRAPKRRKFLIARVREPTLQRCDGAVHQRTDLLWGPFAKKGVEQDHIVRSELERGLHLLQGPEASRV
mmetsp:Transcript_13125/g.37003  ORF Transcript_13125/g.37003 Transcript_13125/m.37003 type:complete len:276 (-) Transcript_13125:625-1452(-)